MGKRKAERERIDRIVERWRVPLGLGWYRITIECSEDSGDFDEASMEGASVAGCCSADWRYMLANIRLHTGVTRELPDADLERVIVHELVHVLVQELQDNPEDHGHVERVVELLTKAFLWVRDADKPSAVPA